MTISRVRNLTIAAVIGLTVSACGSDHPNASSPTVAPPASVAPVTSPVRSDNTAVYTGPAPVLSDNTTVYTAPAPVPADVVDAAHVALLVDPLMLATFGPSFEVLRSYPTTAGDPPMVVFTITTPQPVSLPPGTPMWKGHGEGSNEPLEDIVTTEPWAPASRFDVFVRADHTIRFILPIPDALIPGYG